MTQHWEQLIYGKFITKEDGPIRKGEEHKITGRSQGVTPELEKEANPNVTGIGNSETTDWEDLRWNKEGGAMVQRLLLDNGAPRFMVGKIRGRAESREGGFGRKYTQAQYATILAEEITFPPTLSLYHALNPIPQLVGSSQVLPTFSIENVVLPLPNNWIDLIEPILKVLLSGLHLSINTKTRSMEELVHVTHIIQSAIPRTLSWRLTTKIGAFECPPEDAVLSFVHKLKYSMPRMVGFRLNDHQKNTNSLKDISGAEPHPIDPTLMIGDRYIDYLRAQCAHCSNTEELQAQIAQDFTDFMRWDYFSPSWSFKETTVEFMKVLFEDDGLSTLRLALNGQGDFPSIHVFYYRKKEALLLLLNEFWTYPEMIVQTLEPWSDIWDEIVPTAPQDIQYAMQWMKYHKRIQFDAVNVLSRDIPTAYHPIIQLSLENLLSDITIHQQRILNHILEHLTSYPTWIQSAFAKHETSLTLKCRYLFNIQGAIPHLPSSTWFSSLNTESLVAAFETPPPILQSILDSDSEIQARFLDEVHSISPLLAIYWGNLHPVALKDSTLMSHIKNWERYRSEIWMSKWPSLLNDYRTLHFNTQYATPVFQSLALEHFHNLTVADQDALWGLLSTQVGRYLAQWVFNRSSSSLNGDSDPLLLDSLFKDCQEGRKPIQPLLEELPKLPNDFHCKPQLIEFVTGIINRQVTMESPLVQFFQHLKQKLPIQHIPPISPSDFQFWLTHLKITLTVNTIDSNDELTLLYIQTNPPLETPSPSLISSLLSEPVGGPRISSWKHVLQEVDWHEAHGWRWLFRDFNTPSPLLNTTESIELELLEVMSLAERIQMLKRGILIPHTLFDRLTREVIRGFTVSDQNLLLWWATHFLQNEEPTANEVQHRVVLAWMSCNLSARDKEQLRTSVTGTSGFFSAFTQQLTDYFDELPTTLPVEWTPEVWLKEYLLSQPSDIRSGFFV